MSFLFISQNPVTELHPSIKTLGNKFIYFKIYLFIIHLFLAVLGLWLLCEGFL